ncbi:hypothetical protein CDL12_29277 [Handroanthus impetiginosus]|uniref:Uncharacterized protein n=1 Tax=Handroanthus impetiginosus TaxID=429701 RepID=A0A2G9FYU8_9LAMI|nr:hypothetical protein CDL12_29277 [Handroanthus impetiginosus]
MSARLMKKVLNEQAMLQKQQQLNSDDDSESLESVPPAGNKFDLLEDDDDNSNGDLCYLHHSDQSAKWASMQDIIFCNLCVAHRRVV